MAELKISNNKTVLNSVLSILVLGHVVSADLALGTPVYFGGAIAEGANTGIRPIRSIIHTFADRAGIRLYSTNTKTISAMMSLSVTDGRNRPIAADVYPAEIRLKAQATGEFVVVVAMRGDTARDFRVCAVYSGVTDTAQCGTYLAKRADWS